MTSPPSQGRHSTATRRTDFDRQSVAFEETDDDVVRSWPPSRPEVLCGIDYSEGSVRASQATNADAISAGRVRIQLGSVAALPFRNQTFDVVTAVETHYYWPDLLANTSEIFRVVKPGGAIAFIAETARDSDSNVVARATMSLLMRAALLSVTEHRDLLEQAGFTDISTLRYPGKGWVCVTGRKPGSRIN